MSAPSGAEPSPEAESLDTTCPGPEPVEDVSADPDRGDRALDEEGAPLPAAVGEPPDGPPKLDDAGGFDGGAEFGDPVPAGGGGGAVTVNVAVTYPTLPV